MIRCNDLCWVGFSWVWFPSVHVVNLGFPLPPVVFLRLPLSPPGVQDQSCFHVTRCEFVSGFHLCLHFDNSWRQLGFTWVHLGWFFWSDSKHSCPQTLNIPQCEWTQSGGCHSLEQTFDLSRSWCNEHPVSPTLVGNCVLTSRGDRSDDFQNTTLIRTVTSSLEVSYSLSTVSCNTSFGTVVGSLRIHCLPFSV